MTSLDQLQHRRLTDLLIHFLLSETPDMTQLHPLPQWLSGTRLLAESPFFGASEELWEDDSTALESLETEPPRSSTRRVEEPAPNSASTTERRMRNMEVMAQRVNWGQTSGDFFVHLMEILEPKCSSISCRQDRPRNGWSWCPVAGFGLKSCQNVVQILDRVLHLAISDSFKSARCRDVLVSAL